MGYRISTLMLCVMVMLGVSGVVKAADAEPQDALMSKIKEQVMSNDKLSDKMKKYVVKNLLPYSKHELLVAETVHLNNKKVTMDEIKKIDEAWKNAEEELPIMTEKMSNASAKGLKEASKKLGTIAEVFLMCNKGALVGTSELTGDYWQGDEAKWQNSFNKGKGGIDVGEAEFDESANTTLQQISLPIVNKKGEVIGAITWGIQVDKM